MSRRAVLKLAGYKVSHFTSKTGANWYWNHTPTRESSPFFHKTETKSWESAWRHFIKEKQHD